MAAIRKALVNAQGTAVNVIVVDDADLSVREGEESPRYVPPRGLSLIGDGLNAEPGGVWDGAKFTKRAPPQPVADPREAELEAIKARLDALEAR